MGWLGGLLHLWNCHEYWSVHRVRDHHALNASALRFSEQGQRLLRRNVAGREHESVFADQR